MSDVTRLSASALAGWIREGRLTSADAVDAYLERIASVDSAVSAYVRVLGDRAAAHARTLDAEARAGRLRGPLHGVPVAIKDLIAIAGVPMTAGSSFLGALPERETATVVGRLEAAGAVVLGTTALHEFAFGMTSVNPHGRTPRNPWDLDRIAGGSSGGSGAAVAAGLAAGAVGTDTGGSIRIPAALCGIVGLKPTFGRVSRHAVLPLARSYDTVGPMARTVEDAALLLEAMAGVDPADPRSSQEPVARYRDEMLRVPAGTRVGQLVGAHFEDDLDPAVERAVAQTARVLRSCGLEVEPLELPEVTAWQGAQLTILRAEAAAFHRATFPGRKGEYGPDVRAMLQQGAAVPAAEVWEARAIQAVAKVKMAGIMAGCHVLLSPALPMGAPRIADVDPGGTRWPEVRRVLGRFTRLFNLIGLPTIVLPAGLSSEGLPVSVQLAGRPFEEGLLLGVARQVEREVNWSLPDLPRVQGPHVAR
jgi:aspartyl-tRNA(Asn)/glutamyl-tRNA(Gln) amidotransferase subunit A